MTGDTIITLPTLAEIGKELPELSDFAKLTGAKVFDTAQDAQATVNEPTAGLIWTRDNGTDQLTQTAATLGEKGVIKQNVNSATRWVGVVPSIFNPGAAGFDVADTKADAVCLTYHGKLVYWPQREVASDLAKELTVALMKAERPGLHIASIRAVGKFATPWRGDNSLIQSSICYAYHGKCYVRYVDEFNTVHWLHCEPLRVIANPEQNTVRAATALFASSYHDPSNMWGPKHNGISGLEWFLNHGFLQDLLNSVKYGKYITERAVKRRHCMFEPRGLKQLARNALYTLDDITSTNEPVALKF